MNQQQDILVCHWGATMSLYKFVQILKRTPKTLLVRELETETLGNAGYGQPIVSPKWPLKPHLSREGEEEQIRLYKDGERWFTRKHGFYQSYQLWDGQPRTEDHND